MAIEAKSTPKKFRDLGITERPKEGESLYKHVVKTVMGSMETIRHGEGRFIYPVKISDRQKRYLFYHLSRYHPGLRDRITIVRGYPADENAGTLIKVSARR